MLPSRGFFKEEPCPLYEVQDCDRPHCHFRHKRGDPSSLDDLFNALEEVIDKIPELPKIVKQVTPEKIAKADDNNSEVRKLDEVTFTSKTIIKEEENNGVVKSTSEQKIQPSYNPTIIPNKIDYVPTKIKEPQLSKEEAAKPEDSAPVKQAVPAPVSNDVVTVASPEKINVKNESEETNDITKKSEVSNSVKERKKLTEREQKGIDTIVTLLKEDPSRIDLVVNLLKSLEQSDAGKSNRHSSSTSHSSHRKSSSHSHRTSHSSSRSSRSSHKSSHKSSRSRSKDSRHKRKRDSDSEGSREKAKSRRTSHESTKVNNEESEKSKRVSAEKAKRPSLENDDDEDPEPEIKEISSGDEEEDENDGDNGPDFPELSDEEDDDETTLEEQMGRLHDFDILNSTTTTTIQIGSKRRVAHETAYLADHDMLRNKVGVPKKAKVAMLRPSERQAAAAAPSPVPEPPRPLPLHPLLGAPKARIMAVPNAQRMLAAKVTLQKNIVKQDGPSGTISRTVKPGATRQQHSSQDDDVLRPIAPPGSKSVPQAVRQTIVLRLFKELKCLPTKNERHDESLRMEDQIFQAHKDCYKKYQMGAVSAIMRARRGLQKEGGNSKIESEFYRGSREIMLTTEELIANGFPMYLEEGYATCHLSEDFRYNKKYRHIREAVEKGERYCTRCAKTYQIDPNTGEQTPVPDACIFHSDRSLRRYRGEAPTHKCCNLSTGCQSEPIHVTDIKDYQRLPNCVKTKSKPNPERFQKVLALDCEMVNTRLGIELAQITVVDSDCNIVYEQLVKPYEVVESYNTQFSGITEEKLRGAKKTLKDVQRDLLAMISEETIVVGHSLDSDFRAMHFIHESVCDTSFIYRKEQDAQGNYFKMRLKDLSAFHLGKIIQEDLGGHSAAEDAVAAMQLLLHKVYPHLRKDCTHCS